MSISTNPKPLPHENEVDLIPLIQTLWAHKVTLLAITCAGVAVSLLLYVVSPKQWTASTYITKPSLYNLYKEVKSKEDTLSANPQSVSPQLYSSIQNDIFYTAMGVMTSQSISVKETTPKSGKNEPVLYIASATAPTAEQASDQLKAALDSANNKAIALNLPALGKENSLKAFNTLNDIKAVNIRSAKKLSALGGFLGLILGSAFVTGRFLIRQHKKPSAT